PSCTRRLSLHDALPICVYAGQWMAVIGFLPTIYAAQGISGTTAGLLTAIVAGANAIGNLSAGRLLHRGVAGWQLLITGLATMILDRKSTRLNSSHVKIS